MIERVCPTCLGEDSTKVFHRDFSGMKDIVPFSYYDVVRCTRCGAYFANHIVETMPLVSYYEKLSKYETKAFALSEAARIEYEFAIRLLRKKLIPTHSVLDLGCGNGALLHMLQEQGFKKLTGLEPSAMNCHAIEECWGVRAVPGALGEDVPALSGETFDAVLLVGVLEHLLDVRENVAHALRYLADGGFLYLQVPDIGTFPSCHDLYQQFSVEHVNFFSLASLKNLMQGFGMACVAHANEGCSIYSLWTAALGERPVFQNDGEGQTAMEAYLHNSQHLAGAIQASLEPYRGQSVYLWGAGTHTAMLYQLGLLDDLQIGAIIDSNANYQGKCIYDIPVIAPNELSQHPVRPIVISSQHAQKAIWQQIKEDMKLPHEVVMLYQ